MCGTHHQRYHPNISTFPSSHDVQTFHTSGVPVVRIPSTHSAFRSVLAAPPLPPKSDAVRLRSYRLASDNTAAVEPFSVLPTSVITSCPPIPLPRLSKMKSMTDLLSPTAEKMPKTKEITSDSAHYSSIPKETCRKSSAKSCQSVGRCSVASVKRRNGSHRPATPITQTTTQTSMQSTSTMNIMDESERQFLEEAVRQTYSEETSDSEDSNGSAPYGQILRFPRKQPSLPSPTTDSGLPHSDFDDKRHQGSERSTDDGFFDASLIKREEDGELSEILTSISNQRPNDSFASEEVRGRGLSLLEKNARVMRWIHENDE
ncbi:unnamed protein product [Auanema sp. JU1783]|nr:unnamed protein product [Auanema sp. JU1783]